MISRKNSIINSIYSFAFLVAVFSLFPLIWMAFSGFKAESEVLSVPFRLIPKRFIIANYIRLLKSGEYLRSFGITFFVASVTTVIQLFLNSVAAYAFSRLEFPFKKFLWGYVLSPMFIPGIAILIPSYVVVSKLHMVNNLSVLMVPFFVGVGGVFFLRQYYLNVPNSYEEAAIIDGASIFQIYRYIFLPLSKPPFVLVGMGSFLGLWNAFLWPIITISDSKLFQVMQLLAYYRSQYSVEMAMQVCGTTIAAIPTVLLFLIFQKHLIKGIKISGLK